MRKDWEEVSRPCKHVVWVICGEDVPGTVEQGDAGARGIVTNPVEKSVGLQGMAPERQRPALRQTAVGRRGVEPVVGTDPCQSRTREIDQSNRSTTRLRLDPAEAPLREIVV